MTDDVPSSVVFGPFRLDLTEKVLYADGRPQPLTPKVLETLLVLVSQRGRLVTKQELMERVWPDTFVEEATLAQSISVLRKALGDTPNAPRYIETVPTRGYRFIAPTPVVEPESPAVAGSDAVSPAAALQVPSSRRGWTWIGVGVASALLVTAAGSTYLSRAEVSTPVDGPAARTMLAVLPFTNLGSDPEDEYISDGLTEELISLLGGMQPDRLGVIARTSAMRYKASARSITQIGRELGVGHVLQGSVRREGRRLRVAVQLVQVHDQTHLWSDVYDQDLNEILTMQIRVAQAAARQIQTRFSLPSAALPARRGTVNPAAYELYLKAHYFWNKRTADQAAKALALYQQAVTLDPGYAQAYAEMSRCYLSLSTLTPRQSYLNAKASAEAALAIDDTLAEAHFALASAALHLLDWPKAASAFRRAEALDGRYRNIDFMVLSGDFEEAIAETRRGVQGDPVNFLVHHGMGTNLFYARRYAEATAAFREALELDPRHVWSRVRLGQTLVQQRQYPQAISVLQETGGAGQGTLAHAYILAGQRKEGMALLNVMRAGASRGSYEQVLDIALVYAALNDRPAAFEWLHLAYEQRIYQLIYLKVDPRLDSLRGDARFAELISRIGFPS